MRPIEKIKKNARVTELVAFLKERERKLPLIHAKANIEEVIDTMIRFQHSRLLYVVDDEKKLTGTISLGLLARHVFSRSH
jgi:CBS domain-containing protein